MNKTLTLLLLLIGISSFANNVNIVGNVTVEGKNTSAGINNPANYTYLNFSVAWNNAWRNDNVAPYNYDAVWIFAKYRVNGGEWKHVSINKTGHVSEANTTINGVNDTRGVFLYSSQNFSGNFVSNNNKLKWHYVNDGVNDSDNIEVKLFAIEMVYIPEGKFYLGTPEQEWGGFYKGNNVNDPFEVVSENTIVVGDGASQLNYKSNYLSWAEASSGDRTGIISTEFPNGYSASYIMKYEVTQEQYVDFLNTLTRTQQNKRTSTDVSTNTPQSYRTFVMSKSNSVEFRNGIRCNENNGTTSPIEFFCDYNNNGIANEDNDGQNIACNFISWADAAAYTDWSGLRPITEMEFEKAARGKGVLSNGWELAWANGNYTKATGILNPGTANEIASNTNANANFASNESIGYMTVTKTGGPMRVGCFADANSNRQTSGAGYYGVMNLSDNLRERTVSVGSPKGRTFVASNGDGNLNVNGDYTNTDWPDYYAEGSGLKGGDWVMGIHFTSRISDRYNSAIENYHRSGNVGMRACRYVQ